MKLTLITPTVRRPWCFARLEQYMQRQTLRWHQWLVVGDQGFDGYSFNLDQQVIERPAGGELHSVNENYLAALPLVTGDAVLCVEDDDWYRGDYLETMASALATSDLIGICPAYYYHIGARKWRNMKNDTHASLAATGFTRAVFPCFEQCARNKVAMPYIDMVLFPHWHGTLEGSLTLLTNDEKKPLQVGLKGCPGNHGCGLGHDPVPGIRDIGYVVLKRWLGPDAVHYIRK